MAFRGPVGRDPMTMPMSRARGRCAWRGKQTSAERSTHPRWAPLFRVGTHEANTLLSVAILSSRNYHPQPGTALTIEGRVKGERSRHTVIVAPPAVEQVGKAWDLIDSRAVVICADHEQAALWAEAAPPEHRAHAVTGLARTAALLKEGRVGLLAGSPPDLAALVARSALKLESIETLVIAWPESFADELDAVLAEAPNGRRVILSWNPPALSEFLERHARRAEVSGDLPLDSDGNPLGPVGSARYAVVSSARRAAGARDTLNTDRKSVV